MQLLLDGLGVPGLEGADDLERRHRGDLLHGDAALDEGVLLAADLLGGVEVEVEVAERLLLVQDDHDAVDDVGDAGVDVLVGGRRGAPALRRLVLQRGEVEELGQEDVERVEAVLGDAVDVGLVLRVLEEQLEALRDGQGGRAVDRVRAVAGVVVVGLCSVLERKYVGKKM